MRYLVLGPVQVAVEQDVSLGGYRQRLVLAVLLSRPNQVLETNWLIDAVWGEHPPRTARKTLQVYVSRLRGLLGPDSIEAVVGGYRANVADGDIDTLQFEALATQARRALASDPRRSAEQSRRALALWRGLPFADLADEPALFAESQRLQERRIEVLEDRTSADLALGHGRGLVSELTDLVAEHPLREGLRANLMLALYRADRQADAVAVFEEGRALLADELGLDPSNLLADLQLQILRHDSALDADMTAPEEPDWSAARNPFKGLRPFQPEDSDDFFGRSVLVDDIVERVRQHPFVTVLGASGSGKSSAVLAGVLPRISADSPAWLVARTKPGTDPWQSALQAMRGVLGPDREVVLLGDDLDLLRLTQAAWSDQRLLLLIDQFEELFGDAVDTAGRDRLLRNLVEAIRDPSSPLSVLTTHRADFTDRLLAVFPDGPLLVEGLVTVLPLSAAELEAAAAGPARRAGVHLEPELVAELVADMSDQPGALPLFEYALTEVFEHRSGPILTRATYRSLGGLRGALARRAEQTYAALEPAVQGSARQVFLRLVAVHQDGAETRRRVLRAELETLGDQPDTVGTVLEAFGAARLLTFDRDASSGQATVDVAHEALLREWPRLRRWLDKAHDDVRLHTGLAAEAAEWQSSGREDGFLIAGARLARYDDWPLPGGIDPNETERTFLARSRQQRTDRQQAEHRTSSRLRRLVAVVSVLAVLAATLAWVAIDRAQTTAASERETHARALAASAAVAVERDPQLAMLLALEATDLTRDDGFVLSEAESALHLGVNAPRELAQIDGEFHLAFHPDGSLLVAGSNARLVDPNTGADAQAIAEESRSDTTLSAGVSSDGSLLITGGNTHEIIVWDGATGELVRRLAGHISKGDAFNVLGVDISPDNTLAASLAPFGEGVVVWDIASGEMVAQSADPRAWPPDTCCYPVRLSFSPDGTQVAANWYDHARVMDVATGEWLFSLDEHEAIVTDIEFLAEGKTLLTSSMDGTLRFWDAETGTPETVVKTDVGQVTSIAVSPDGTRLLVGDDEGQVSLWSLNGQTAAPMMELAGSGVWVYDLDISADGTMGAAAIGLGPVVTWNISDTGLGEVATWSAPGAVAFSNDGTRLLTTDPDTDDPVIVRTSDWQPERTLTGGLVELGDISDLPFDTEHGRIHGAAWSPDDSTLATVVGNYTVENDVVALWDTDTGVLGRTLASSFDLRGSVAFSGDGRLLTAALTGDPGPVAVVWETDSGREVLRRPADVGGRAVDLDGTGERLVTQALGEEGALNVVVVDIDNDEAVVEMIHRPLWRGAATFSPDGTELLTAGANGIARVWDAASGDLLRSLEGHVGAVEHAIWSADGATIVTSGHDGTVRLWDAQTGEMGVVLAGHQYFPDISLSPDGRRLATSDNGSVRIWTLDLDELVEIARDRLTRSLTPDECATHHLADCA